MTSKGRLTSLHRLTCRSNWSKHAFLLVIKGWIKPWLFFSVRFHCKLHEGAARSRRWWPPVLLVWWRSGSRSDCTRCPLDERVRSFHWRCCWCSSPHSCSCGRLNEAQTPTLMRHTDYRWLSVKGSTARADIITLKNKGALLPSMVPFHSTKRFFRLLKCSCSLKCSLRNQKNPSFGTFIFKSLIDTQKIFTRKFKIYVSGYIIMHIKFPPTWITHVN